MAVCGRFSIWIAPASSAIGTISASRVIFKTWRTRGLEILRKLKFASGDGPLSVGDAVDVVPDGQKKIQLAAIQQEKVTEF